MSSQAQRVKTTEGLGQFSDTALAYHAPGPGFNPQYHIDKNKQATAKQKQNPKSGRKEEPQQRGDQAQQQWRVPKTNVSHFMFYAKDRTGQVVAEGPLIPSQANPSGHRCGTKAQKGKACQRSHQETQQSSITSYWLSSCRKTLFEKSTTPSLVLRYFRL